MERQRLAGLTPRRRHGDSGFLYVELLVAMAIFATALMAIVPMYTLATRLNAISADLAVGATLAQEKMEGFRAIEFSSLTAETGTETIAMDTNTYQRSWLIEDATPHTGMTQITVSVRPVRLQSFGPDRSTSIRAYRAR